MSLGFCIFGNSFIFFIRNTEKMKTKACITCKMAHAKCHFENDSTICDRCIIKEQVCTYELRFVPQFENVVENLFPRSEITPSNHIRIFTFILVNPGYDKSQSKRSKRLKRSNQM
ncbi:hypothetical protein Glove_296g32 [Diversispora epigaea]|uniref:Zn(2)-C6 fungal-type domain-containing protein n=1 Tax=Diversispora epigaea TaxID=1348612 RepID=A0A397I4T6_9GLOM|nr:hypothetical protein Glove_296g32 [Diversispora epigaea]